jgi:Flp pilus assembly protein CpaB
MIGKVEAGDRVDVFASLFLRGATGAQGRPILKVVAQNALVLEAPAQATAGVGGANQTANVLLRVNRDEAAQMAFAVDNGKVWVILRPRAGSRPGKPGAVTDRSLLADIKPGDVYDDLRREIRGRP